MTALATWRAQQIRDARASADGHSAVAAALDDARAETFLLTARMASSIFSENAAPVADMYPQAIVAIDNDMQAARAGLTAMGELDEVAVLNAVDSQMNQLMQDPDVSNLVTSLNEGDKTKLGQQYYPRVWPKVDKMMADLQQLANVERSRLAAEQATANSASDHTFGLLIGLSLLAFLGAFATLGIFIMSLLRPLSSLQASARAITSGNLEARAKASGPEEVASVAHDFNEMTQALLDRTERLAQSQKGFRDVLEVSRDLVYKLNMETRTYDYVSPSALELLGFKPEEVAAMGLEGIRERFHPDDRERFRTFPRDLPNGGDEHRLAPTIEYRWKCRDGEYRWFSDNRAIVRDEDGKVLAVVGTVRDMTSRKAAEDALRDSEERFRTLSGASPMGVFSIDTPGKFTYANEQVAANFGVRPEELVGQLWGLNIHPDDRRATIEEGVKVLKEARTFSLDYRIVKPDGEVRWMRTVSNPLLARDGRVTSYVGVSEDITERKQAEDALRESEERFRTLSASAPIGIFLSDVRATLSTPTRTRWR